MMKKLFFSIILLFSFLVPTLAVASSSPIIAKINGVQLTNAQGIPFVSCGTTYVPLNPIAQKMGDKVTWIKSQTKSIIIKKDKTVVSVRANQSIAVWNGKIVPLKTKQVNKASVPMNVKAIYKNGQLYVPVEFVSNAKGLGYPVQIKKESGKTVVYVGKIPTPKQPSQQSQTKPQTQPKRYPDGWVAPVLKSSWSPDEAHNFAILKNELGFTDDGHRYAIPGAHDAILVFDSGSGNGYEVMFSYKGWTDEQIPASYRIPIVSKELFKLYFGTDADRVWNYFNSNNIPDKFTANGRTVKAFYSEADGSVYLQVGYPHKPF
jgi:hypothetical protein